MNTFRFLDSIKDFYPEVFDSLFDLLIKNSNSLFFSENKDQLPLLFFKERSIHLWHQNDIVSPFPFVFSVPDEIYLIVQHLIFEGENIYVSKNIPDIFSEKFIKRKINESLKNNNEEEFRYWRKILYKG